MSYNVIQNQQTWQWFPKEGSSSFSEQRGRGTKGWTCIRPPKRVMAQPLMVSAMSSALLLYGQTALILPYWSESPFLECPDSCLRLCPTEITEHFSASEILLLQWPFSIAFALQRMLSSCFYHLLSATLQRRPLLWHRAKISSHRPHRYIQSINQGSGPVFSLLALRVVCPETHHKTWTWANTWVLWRGKVQIWSPSQSKSALGHAYAVGDAETGAKALYQKAFRANILCALPLKSGNGSVFKKQFISPEHRL